MAKFRASLNLTSTSNKRYTDEVSFGGVDFSSPRFSVASNHALDELNYMYRDGLVQKRFGTKQYAFLGNGDFYYYAKELNELVVDTTATTDTTKWEADGSKPTACDCEIHNMWNFNGLLLVHAGELVYLGSYAQAKAGQLKPISFKNTGSYTPYSKTYKVYYTLKFPNKRLNGISYGNRFYIFTGKRVMVVEGSTSACKMYSLTDFGNPYVPTTTIGIVQSEAETGGSRQTYEQPNLLTDLRINGCVSGADNKDANTYTRTFTLDATATSIENVTIKLAGARHSHDGTWCTTISESSARNEHGFCLPYCGQTRLLKPKAEVASSKTDYNFVIPFDTTAGSKISFAKHKVILKSGKERSYIASTTAPAISIEANDSIAELKPGTTRYDIVALKGIDNEQVRDKATTNGYYVRIFGGTSAEITNGTFGVDHEILPNSNGEWEASQFQYTDNGSAKYYERAIAIIYALEIDSDTQEETWSYCTFNIIINSTSLAEGHYEGTTIDDVTTETTIDANDYIGNGMVQVACEYYKPGTYTDDVPRTTTLWLLSLNTEYDVRYGEGISDEAPDFDLTDFVGKFDDSNGVVIEYGYSSSDRQEAYPTFMHRGTYTGNGEITFTPCVAKLSYKSVQNSIKNGIFSKISYPFRGLADGQTGYLLYDKNSYLKTGEPDKNACPVGYYLMEDGKTNKIIMMYDYGNTSVGESNIEVRFHASGYENNADDINKCTICALFGAKNYKNRLFVTGNADKPTYDWHTGDSDDGDGFDYFPDTGVAHYGSNTAVVGYGIVSDGRMMVLKKASIDEPSIYYRTATYTSLADESGSTMSDATGSTIYTESYPITQTNSHIGGISQQLMADFNGDLIFVDTDGRIVGLDNEGTTYDNQRVATTRSKLIDKRIMSETGQLLFANGNDLYYFTDKGTYYTNYDSSYEWYPLGLPVTTCVTQIDGKVIFGKPVENGESKSYIYEFTEGEYSDIEIYYTKSGELSILNGEMIISDDLHNHFYNDGYKTLNIGNSIWGCVATIDSSHFAKGDDSKFVFGAPKGLLHPDMKVRFSTASSTTLSISMANEDEIGNDTDCDWFRVTTAYATLVPSGTTSIDIYIQFDFKTNFTIADYADGGAITLKVDDYTMSKFSGSLGSSPYLYKSTPVSATYITAPYLSSGLTYRKVVDSYTIVSDTGEENEIYLKVATNEVSLSDILDKESYSVGKQVNYSDIDYSKLDYARYTLPYTQTLLARYYGSFISFSLASPNAVNSTLTKVSYLYHYAGKTYGKS